MLRLRKYLFLAMCAISVFGCTTVQKPQTSSEPVSQLAEGFKNVFADQYSTAEATFAPAGKPVAGSAMAWRGMGLVDFMRGQDFDAIDAFSRSLALDPASATSAAMRIFMHDYLDTAESVSTADFTFNTKAVSKGIDSYPAVQAMDQLEEYQLKAAMDLKALGELRNKGGVLHTWTLNGPYPNSSSKGFEAELFSDSTGLDLRSAQPKLRIDGLTGKMCPANYLGGSADSLYYAESKWVAEADGVYRVILDRVGALKVWLDGELLYSDSAFETADNALWKAVTLKKGSHSIVVKTQARRGNATFRLRILPTSFDIHSDESIASILSAIPGINPAERSPLLSDLTVTWLLNPDNPENLFWLCIALEDAGYRASARTLLETRKVVDSDFYRFLLSNIYSRIGLQEASLKLVESMDDNFAPKHENMIQRAYSNSSWTELNDLLASSRLWLGSTFTSDIYDMLYNMHRNKSSLDKYTELYKKYRQSPIVPYLVYYSKDSYEFSFDGLLKDMGKGLFKLKATELRFFAANRNGDLAQVSALGKTLQALEGDSLQIAQYKLEADLKLGAISFVGAGPAVEELIAKFPNSTDLLQLDLQERAVLKAAYESALEDPANRGKFEPDRNANDEKIKKIAELYLRLDPSQYWARLLVAQVSGQPSPDDDVVIPDPSAVIKSWEASKASPNADWVSVLDATDEYYFQDGGKRIYRTEIKQVLSLAGRADQSTQILESTEWSDRVQVQQAYVYKKSGIRVGAAVAGSRISMSGLEIGDYTVLQYTVDGAREPDLNRDFWTSKWLNSWQPQHEVRLRVVFPSFQIPTVAFHNIGSLNYVKKKLTPTIASSLGIEIDVVDPKPVQYKVSGIDNRDLLPWVDISTLASWKPIQNWYTGLYFARSVPDDVIRDKAAALTKGLTSEADKIKALYDFVSAHIEYEDLAFQYSAYVPQYASSVLRDGFGDCKDKSTLLIALLRAVGIDATIALNTPEYSGPNSFLPSTRFNHAIVIVHGAKQNMVLDPTSQFWNYPEIPAALVGSKYLPIEQKFGDTLDLSVLDQPHGVGSRFFINIAGEDVYGNFLLDGALASEIRQWLRYDTQSFRDANFADFVHSVLPRASIDSYSVQNLGENAAMPGAVFKAKVPSLSGASNAMGAVGWVPQLPPSLASQYQGDDLEVDIPLLQSPVQQTVSIEIPASVKVDTLPASQEFHFRDAWAKFSYQKKGSILVVNRDFYFPHMRIAASEKKDFLLFVSAVLDAQSAEVQPSH